MNKVELKKELKRLGITVVGNKIKKRDMVRIVGTSPQELNKFKANENNEWTVYKLPNDADSVDGVNVKDTFTHLCADTHWQVEVFWQGFKGMDPRELLIYVSKNRNTNDPKHKLGTLDGNVYVGADEQPVEVGGLNLPSTQMDTAPALTSDDPEVCKCDFFEMMRNGCNCGAMQREKERKARVLHSQLVTKAQLKDQLYALNIPIYAGCKIKKKDIKRALASYTIKKK